MDVFEYGSGNSTLWYSKKVNSVSSVEDDKQWFEKVQNNMPDNVMIYHENLVYGGTYCHFSNILNKEFDLIIIDGRDRVNCMKNTLTSLKKNGIIVLDDSEREQYKEGIEFLVANQFKRIDFWGISPGLFYKKCTTVFYKTNNCIGI
jgi:tRNA A58 N-methylase Trm61